MNFLRTAPFGTLFTAAFAIGAACHLAFLIIGPLLDRAMFGVPEEADQEARAIAGARAFWRMYGGPGVGG